MSTFANYMLEANLGICFFLLIYQWALKKETDFRFNRTYLLSSLLVSILMPLLHFDFSIFPFVDQTIKTFWLPEIQVTQSLTVVPSKVGLWDFVFIVYGLGVSIFFALFITRLLKIVKAIHGVSEVSSGIQVIELKQSKEVFSFFKFIFIGQAFRLTEDERDKVINHESIHVRHHHTLDILFINTMSIFFWFNPFIKTYRKSLVQLHEFEADARSVETDEVDEYCSLLAKAALQSSGFQLANHFTNSLTLKRIEMMKTIKKKISKWKAISIVCTALALSLVVGCAHTRSLNSSKNKVYDQVDELPTFGKGPQYVELYDFISKNLRYPEEAVKSKIEGKVFVEFVVEKDGSLSAVKPVKGIGHGCDEEVVRIVKSLPKWNPGEKDGKIVRTKFTIPIVFQLTAPSKGD